MASARREASVLGQKLVGLGTQPQPKRLPGAAASEATPADDWPIPPTAIGTTSDLPAIAAKADDLEAIKKAVDDAASVGGGLWLSYLFVLFYVALAAGAVAHEDLFFERSLKLPFLNIELPLLAFCFLAPILFVIVHAYTLVHLVFLTDKAKRYHQALHDQMGNRPRLSPEQAADRKAKRDGLRRQLPGNIFIQFLAGPSDVRESSIDWLLHAIAWITLVIGPVLLLLLVQIRFLPFHSSLVVWTQRAALALDIVLIWWLWGRVLSGRDVELVQRRGAHQIWLAVGLALSLAVLFFSGAVATFPGEFQNARWAEWRVFPGQDTSGDPTWVSLHRWIFDGPIDETTRRRTSLFSSTLVLTGLNVYEGLGIDDPVKAKWHDFVFRARGRNLKGAIFDLASLPKTDFEGADLEGASLNGTQLQGASLVNAQLRNASLNDAKLQGAALDDAQLQDAMLGDAQLQGATLNRAQLQGALLNGAELQGASLDDAQLQGALLESVELQGASLNFASLQGASLATAHLEGASLESAQLQGASLEGANLQGASLSGANLQGASLSNVQLQGASLNLTQLQGASLNVAALEATDLRGARLWRTYDQTPPSAVEISSGETWEPVWTNEKGKDQPWDNKAYNELRAMIDALPSGDNRNAALKRIQRLNCYNPDPALAPCDPAGQQPPETVAWRTALESAGVNSDSYARALSKVLKPLLCSGDDDAIQVMRGSAFRDRLLAARPTAPDLIDDLTNKDSKDCPVSAALTNADRTQLLRIKRAIEEAQN
jgi:uncharacterized protein YjbI with pentapeptide repeats